jgi:hypothetical protein
LKPVRRPGEGAGAPCCGGAGLSAAEALVRRAYREREREREREAVLITTVTVDI